MNTPSRPLAALALCATLGYGLACATAQAAGSSWTDQISSAANALSQSNNSAATANTSNPSTNVANTGTSLASMASLLNGGDQALSTKSMNNAAGVLQYCVKNNLLSSSSTSSVKNQLLSKLGITSPAESQKTDYQQGLAGLLTTSNNGQLNLNSLSASQLGEKVKTKACDVVLKQSKNFISL